MKKEALILNLLLALAVCLFLLLLTDILSLHDIKKDYISREALETLRMNSLPDLPEWTHTSAEWTEVQISVLVKVIISATNLLLIFLLLKNYRRKH